MKRLKEDKEERLRLQKEREEVEKWRNMTDAEREAMRAKDSSGGEEKQDVAYNFMQKYYHKGAFYLDGSDDEQDDAPENDIPVDENDPDDLQDRINAILRDKANAAGGSNREAPEDRPREDDSFLQPSDMPIGKRRENNPLNLKTKSLINRDYNMPTMEDRQDKSALPEVMQKR
mmetsp:Transcript_8477/g.12956  ORF Transcript_8477/g.12956 Transcript_8477/m.12956 type:complete len:174 (-) Transcript_8477:187-708(-)